MRDIYGDPIGQDEANPVITKPTADSLYIINGVTTGGTDTTLTDTSKDMDADVLKDKIVIFTMGDVDYIRKILSNTANTITFGTVGAGSPAIATLGMASPAEGKVSITRIAEGAAGDCFVELVAGTGNSFGGSASFDAETGILTLTSTTSEIGVPTGLMPGNVQGLLTAANITDYTATADVIGSPIPIEADPVAIALGESVSFGSGLEDGGQITISTVSNTASLNGTTVVVVENTEPNIVAPTVEWDAEAKTLTIGSPTDGSGVAQSIAAGSLVTAINSDATVSAIFEASEIFDAGTIFTTDTAIFAGAVDPTNIPEGTSYWILD